MEQVQTVFQTVSLDPTPLAVTNAQQLVDILGMLRPRQMLDLEELVQDTDISREDAVELVSDVRGQERAEYWLQNPIATNGEFRVELATCLLERRLALEPLVL